LFEKVVEFIRRPAQANFEIWIIEPVKVPGKKRAPEIVTDVNLYVHLDFVTYFT
jgi:hypothetical protein